MIPNGIVEQVEELVLALRWKEGRLPSTYLRLPLGARFRSIAIWNQVEERFRKRLTLWKRKFISKGGRLTLIKSTLSSLPIYFLSLFHISRIVKLRLKKIQREFLWGDGGLEKKFHHVKWSIVCLEKSKDELGIRYPFFVK